MNTGGVTFKTGIVSATKVGFAKVKFEELDGMETQWLVVNYTKTHQDKCVWTLDVGEHVNCIMDEHLEDGCILGAAYSDAEPPPVSSPDKFHMRFKDGGLFEYDRARGDMTIVAKGEINIKATGNINLNGAFIHLNEGG